MELIKILEGTLANLFAATIVALSAWLFSLYRNSRLEKRLEEGISPNGVGIGYDPAKGEGSFNIQIHNYSHVQIRVRELILLAAEGQAYIQMKYDSEYGIQQTPLLNKIFLPDFKKMHFSKGSPESDSIDGGATLPPLTMGLWRVEPKKLGERKWFIRDVMVIVEYSTIFGNTSVVKLGVKEETLKLVREQFHEVSKCVREGTPLPLPASALKELAKQRKNITSQSTSPAKSAGRTR